MATPGKSVEVLLVEDNPGDVRLTQEVLGQSKHSVNMSVAEDGEEAMAQLRREGEHKDSPRPDLIILDLKLPKKSGEEVLAEITADPGLRKIPIVILTGTTAESSLLQSYGIPPARLLKKPIKVGNFDAIMTMLPTFAQRPIQMPATETPEEAGKRWWWPFG